MQRFIVTMRTTPKIAGKLCAPGSTVRLCDQTQRAIIDQLTESGTLRLIDEVPTTTSATKQPDRARVPKRSRSRKAKP
jgi:hypothetical protein